MIPPLIMRLHIRPAGRGGFRLWLPLFIVWLLLLPLLMLLLPFILVAEVILGLTRSRITPLGMLFGILGIVSALRGLHVDVDNARDGTKVFVDLV
jgi:hypothetical protein